MSNKQKSLFEWVSLIGNMCEVLLILLWIQKCKHRGFSKWSRLCTKFSLCPDWRYLCCRWTFSLDACNQQVLSFINYNCFQFFLFFFTIPQRVRRTPPLYYCRSEVPSNITIGGSGFSKLYQPYCHFWNSAGDRYCTLVTNPIVEIMSFFTIWLTVSNHYVQA